MKKRAGGVAGMIESTCLASVSPCVQTPVLRKKKKRMVFQTLHMATKLQLLVL
jgi:hypothetical protein